MTYDKEYYQRYYQLHKEEKKQKAREWYEKKKEERLKYVHQYQKGHRDELNAYQRKRRKEDKNTIIRCRAHEKVANAVLHGFELHKPCEVCGAENSFAHHDDYTKPLEVRFLCQKHHDEWHKHNTPIYE